MVADAGWVCTRAPGDPSHSWTLRVVCTRRLSIHPATPPGMTLQWPSVHLLWLLDSWSLAMPGVSKSKSQTCPAMSSPVTLSTSLLLSAFVSPPLQPGCWSQQSPRALLSLGWPALSICPPLSIPGLFCLWAASIPEKMQTHGMWYSVGPYQPLISSQATPLNLQERRLDISLRGLLCLLSCPSVNSKWPDPKIESLSLLLSARLCLNCRCESTWCPGKTGWGMSVLWETPTLAVSPGDTSALRAPPSHGCLSRRGAVAATGEVIRGTGQSSCFLLGQEATRGSSTSHTAISTLPLLLMLKHKDYSRLVLPCRGPWPPTKRPSYPSLSDLSKPTETCVIL